jgi:hypothetical protein
LIFLLIFSLKYLIMFLINKYWLWILLIQNNWMDNALYDHVTIIILNAFSYLFFTHSLHSSTATLFFLHSLSLFLCTIFLSSSFFLSQFLYPFSLFPPLSLSLFISFSIPLSPSITLFLYSVGLSFPLWRLSLIDNII